MAHILWKKSDEDLISYQILKKPIIIGRDPNLCNIVLPDPRVSRRHCSITPVGGTFIIEDLGSRNGTILNNERISRAVLFDRSDIQIGKILLSFIDGPPPKKSKVKAIKPIKSIVVAKPVAVKKTPIKKTPVKRKKKSDTDNKASK
jgi:pSer/pThr/pTyr-binding forkhead associated (FHA) protein